MLETLIFLLVALALALILINSSAKAKHKKELSSLLKHHSAEKNNLQSEIKSHESTITTQSRQLDELSKYQHIVNIAAFADGLKDQANKEYAEVITEVEQIKSIARSDAKGIREKANTILQNANEQSGTIIANANARAEEIAGEALEAKRNADHYDNTIKAMRNIIKGYGDEYLKPTHSLLDDLAEEYGHKEAGVELKKARERSKFMVKNESAATCKYVEVHRRRTAVNFVMDAFNGKVDSILGRVKHDNFGKLEQEIKDAYSIVNNNGKAFRDAIITKEYLDARIEELHWVVRVIVLREEEREEQKRIKEAIREEERARREYEKAIRDAEKEEKMLQKAMEKVRKQFEDASEQEKQKFQQQLDELQSKYEEAELKNQRALSMAQQTKRGHVYIISNIGSFGEDVFKIGLTRRLEPLDRVKELGDASVPFSFDVHAMIHSEDAPALEKELHRTFVDNQMNKVNARKEFFQINISSIKAEIDKQGIETKWTLKAEAAEYRESLAMKSITEVNPN
ncbi:DUF4041 domain-containing protein [Carboxylicivirga sp. M1479]|nr:DUF4041 domain-containing protein [Carboxylicivirga sp. M1479]